MIQKKYIIISLVGIICLLFIFSFFHFKGLEAFGMPTIDTSSMPSKGIDTTSMNASLAKNGIDTDAISSSASSGLSGVTSLANSEFAYLDPITDENRITNDTLTKIWEKLKVDYPSITTSLQDAFKENATEEEGKSFLTNNRWPWDSFVENYIIKNKGTSSYKDLSEETRLLIDDKMLNNKLYSNRMVLNTFRSGFPYLTNSESIYESIPLQGAFFSKKGYDAGNNNIFKCDQRMKLMNNSTLINDFSTLPTLLKGFKYINDACNPCYAPLFKPYTCMYTLDGKISSPFDIMWGMPNKTESTPSLVSGEKSASSNSFGLLDSATGKDTESESDKELKEAEAAKLDADAKEANANARLTDAKIDEQTADARLANTRARQAELDFEKSKRRDDELQAAKAEEERLAAKDKRGWFKNTFGE